jgi:DNA-binding winged helix-turn-helix (wHTH) protein/Tol biopolymer transport system component
MVEDKYYFFDDFKVDASRRILLKGGQVVPLKPKSFDLLLVLIKRRGEIFSKNDLLDAVWENQFVEEKNLTVQIAALRKAFGERKDENRFIATVPGKGYRFVAPLQNSPNEIIYETKQLERITIEEEIIDERKLLPGSTFSWPKFAFYLFPVIVLLLLVGYLWKKTLQVSSSTTPFANSKIKQLTNNGNVQGAALSPDGKFYAYLRYEKGEYKNSLWLGQIERSNEIQLRPPDENFMRGLAFSPDSKTLYFTLTKPREWVGDLYKMPIIGGVAEKVLENVHSRLALSPDGSQVTFFRRSKLQENSAAIVVVNLDRTGEREIAIRPNHQNFTSVSPVWSPDGSLLAVGAETDEGEKGEKTNEIFVVKVADGEMTKLSDYNWQVIYNLIWRRDGQGLIVNATNQKETIKNLWYVAFPGGNVSNISQDTDSYSGVMSIPSDGNSLLTIQVHREANIWIAPSNDLSKMKQVTFSSINGLYGWNGFDWISEGHIFFSAGVDNTYALYSMKADGSQIKQITPAGFFDQQPTATADGRLIFFESNRSGGSEIWRVQADGSELKPLTTGGSNYAPHVTPDGQHVVYLSGREGKLWLSRISIEGGESIPLTDQTILAAPRVSPDGKSVAYIHKESGKPNQLGIISIEGGKLLKLFEVPRTLNYSQSLRWTPDGKTICYRDWSNGIWTQDLEGGSPKKLEGVPEEKIYNFEWSPDGKSFAFVRGRAITDAVLIIESK